MQSSIIPTVFFWYYKVDILVSPFFRIVFTQITFFFSRQRPSRERNARTAGINWNYALHACAQYENGQPDKASGQLNEQLAYERGVAGPNNMAHGCVLK